MKKLTSFLLTVIMVCCLTITASCTSTPSSSSSDGGNSSIQEVLGTNKVILFIGDGMGLNHIANTQLYYGENMYFTGFETHTLVSTDSLSGVTDSAAAATAMATGTRTKNGYIGIDENGDNLTSITELAKQNGIGAGVVTTKLITDATPACFSAHASSRNNYAEIIISQMNSQIDLLLGMCDYSHSKYANLFMERGFNYVDAYSELNPYNPRIVAGFSDVLPTNNTDAVPSLTQLATFSIEYMEKNYPNGYFLMIEGAKIDSASHDNNLQFMMQNLYDFNNAIKTVDGMLDDDYTIIVTADHETGNLQLAGSKEELNNSLYLSTGHTGTAVPLYYKSTLSLVPEMLNGDYILNTQVFDLCRLLLNI